MTYTEARDVLKKACEPLLKQKDDGTYHYEELVTDSDILEALAVVREEEGR